MELYSLLVLHTRRAGTKAIEILVFGVLDTKFQQSVRLRFSTVEGLLYLEEPEIQSMMNLKVLVQARLMHANSVEQAQSEWNVLDGRDI